MGWDSGFLQRQSSEELLSNQSNRGISDPVLYLNASFRSRQFDVTCGIPKPVAKTNEMENPKHL